jgi:hypothetical protein
MFHYLPKVLSIDLVPSDSDPGSRDHMTAATQLKVARWHMSAYLDCDSLVSQSYILSIGIAFLYPIPQSLLGPKPTVATSSMNLLSLMRDLPWIPVDRG